MRLRLPTAWLSFAAAGGLLAAGGPPRRWAPDPDAPFREVLYRQSSSEADEGSGHASQRIRKTGSLITADYGFKNFNDDELTIHFQLPQSALEAYSSGFGYRKKDLDDLSAWHEAARQEAYRRIVGERKGQAQLDAALGALKTEYDRRVRDYMASRGFRVLPGKVVKVDMPQLVKKNSELMKSVAQAFDHIAISRHYDSDTLIGAAASMVQTALIYRVPETIEGGVHTGGVIPPVKALAAGWGDCDSKTGLLASILSNWPQMRMLGIAVPDHYLMAILRLPAKGDLFVEYQGLRYALVEPAGPAWLAPGSVGIDTVPLVASSQGYEMEPFF
jgi:hypothetical protein